MGDRLMAVDIFNQAVLAMQDKSKPENENLSYQMFNSSVMTDPTFAEAWRVIANYNGDKNWLPSACAAYRRVIELPLEIFPGGLTQKTKVDMMVNLAHRLHHIGKNDEAREWVMKAIQIDPNVPQAWMNLSLIQKIDGELGKSVESALKAYNMDASPAIETALGFAYLFNRDFANGLRHFEARFPYTMRQFLNYPYPKWLGEPNKNVFLVADQGMGDTLSFSRFVELAAERAKYLHIGVQMELRKFFATAFQHLKNINIFPIPCAFPPADCWTTFMSLPFALGLTNDEIISQPGVKVPDFRMATNWKSTDRKIHIGISWTGSPTNFINNFRTIPMEQFLDLYRVPGIQLYSLQIGPAAQEIHEKGCATLIRDMQPYVRDICDSVSIVKELDLIISVESVLPHIAGAMEIETWIPYSYHGLEFRNGYDGKNPLWYSKHQIFKQDKTAQWQPVFDRIVERLRGRV